MTSSSGGTVGHHMKLGDDGVETKQKSGGGTSDRTQLSHGSTCHGMLWVLCLGKG